MIQVDIFNKVYNVTRQVTGDFMYNSVEYYLCQE